MFTGASPFSDFVDTTFLAIVGVSALVLLGLVVAMVIFIIRYSRKRNPHPTNIEGNVPLEITWTVIPLILFMGMFYLGWEGYLRQTEVPEGAVPIRVTARMWSWTFTYPNGLETDTLVVPARVPVALTLRSLDVNHSMYIPAFRIKRDAIPNRENTMWFSANDTKSVDIACAEYCGLRHSYMYTRLVALDSASFVAWYQERSARAGKTYEPIVPAPSERN